MANPLLSVIIPTHNRPQFLPRAIESALQASPDGSVEVIVVPNGPDESWKTVAESFKHDQLVQWHPIFVSHANAARNHGMQLATGVYLRFLDDDDYLYPETCLQQCEIMEASGLNISSGAVDIVNSKKNILKTLFQPSTDDLVVAALSPNRRTQNFAHLYRLSYIKKLRWDEDRSIGQDTAWFIKIAIKDEEKWHRTDDIVGAWVQHHGHRISRGRDPGANTLHEMSMIIQDAYKILERSNRLTPERRQAAADALWTFLQKGLRYDQSYWTSVAEVAEGYYPGRRPPSAIHRIPILNILDPLFVEKMIIPVRIAYHPLRRLLERFGINRV